MMADHHLKSLCESFRFIHSCVFDVQIVNFTFNDNGVDEVK